MKVVVDSETGEVLRELSDYDRILSNSVYKNLKNSKSIKFNDFITFNMLSLPKVYTLLTPTERDVLFGLSQFMQFGSNEVKTGKKFSRKVAAEHIGYTQKTVGKAIKGLLEKDVLYLDEKQKLYINPFILVKGRRTKNDIIEHFKGSIFDE